MSGLLEEIFGKRPEVDHARVALAASYAIEAHADQTRKGTRIPYASHLLGVTALVLEHGGTTEQAIAGLLHDVVEDQGGQARLDDVRRVFGDTVAELVHALSDAAPAVGEAKAPWRARKERYLAHLKELVREGSPAVLISACDRLHNLTAIAEDLEDHKVGADVFARFNGPDADAVLWNHRSVVGVLIAAASGLVPRRLKAQLALALARVERGAVAVRERVPYGPPPSPLLELPSGTTILPDECGFVMPDGPYLRLHRDGVRLELADGRSVTGERHVGRPQLMANRMRVGGNPHGYGPHQYTSYVTATSVAVRLPDRLAIMDDGELIELCSGILRAIKDIEIRIDLDDGDVVAEFADGQPYSHIIDVSAA